MDKRTKNQQKDKSYWNFSQSPIIETKEDTTYKVIVTYPQLRIRRAPDKNAECVGIINNMGEYTILEENNGFGKIAADQWINLSYTTKK